MVIFWNKLDIFEAKSNGVECRPIKTKNKKQTTIQNEAQEVGVRSGGGRRKQMVQKGV